MPPEFILAVDQGTTNTKAMLVDRGGYVVFQIAESLSVMHPRAGFVEQDANEIWHSVKKAMLECVAYARNLNGIVSGITISNQRETAVAWERGHVPIAYGPAVSWQCRRSAEICERLTEQHARIQELTGLPVDPLATAGKWAWMLEQDASLRAAVDRDEVCFGNIDSWLLANLTRGKEHATDHSNASRTALFDLKRLDWSDELLGLFGISRSVMPELRPSASLFGVCTAFAEIEGVPVVAMIGDSHAALFGHGSYRAGAVKATYGTGSSLMMLTDSLPDANTTLARTIAWSLKAEDVAFALEGNIAMTGSAVAWVGEFLGMTDPVDGAVALAGSVSDAAGLVFVPSMVGLGAPYWDTRARGVLANLERTHKAAHLARAAVDAIAFQVADVLFAMEKASGIAIPELRVDGGATRNDVLMQFQADLIQRPVLRSSNESLSALGAAWLGGLTLGWWKSLDEIEALTHIEDRFEPQVSKACAATRYAEWKLAVARARLREPIGVAA
jgi:glycerol kinase